MKQPTKAAPPPATKNKTPGRSSNRATTRHAPDAAPPASPSKSRPPITRSDVTGSANKTKIAPPKK